MWYMLAAVQVCAHDSWVRAVHHVVAISVLTALCIWLEGSACLQDTLIIKIPWAVSGRVQVKGAEAVLTEDETEAVVAAVAPFQQAYLGTCLTRMSDAATSAFPGGNRSLPTSAELQKFIGCAANPSLHSSYVCINLYHGM